MPDYGPILKELASFFEREHIRFALADGFALQALGRSRLTFDLDLIVDRSLQERVVAHLEELGFETLRCTEGYSNHVRDLDRVDFTYVSGETAELVFAEVVDRQTGEGPTVPVASPEHLAMMKFLAFKNEPTRDRQDLPDLVFLLRLPGIDRAKIREYCSKHGMLKLFDELTT